MAKVVVVIPTYNERENIGKMIEALAVEFPKIKNHSMQLLVVDDTSPDKTYEVVRQKGKKYSWVHLFLNEGKQGLGKAYAKGFQYAMKELKADYIMEFDSDFQHRPDQIKDLVAEIDNGYEYIIGSRYIPGGSIPKQWGAKRKFLSIVGNLVARVGFLQPKLHDLTTGFKITKVKGIMDKIDLDNLYSNSFAYKLHILAAAVITHKAKVIEVPIQFMHREEGESKLIQNEMIESLKVIFLFQIHNPKILRFIKFGTVGGIGFIINAVGIEVFRRMAFTTSLAELSAPVRNIPGLKVMTTPASWSAATGAELAIISNFTLNNIWTFKEKKITKLTELIGSFFKFNGTSLGAVLIQFGVIGGAVLVFADTTLVRQVALILSVIFLITPFNYAVYNLFIWKTWKFPGSKKK